MKEAARPRKADSWSTALSLTRAVHRRESATCTCQGMNAKSAKLTARRKLFRGTSWAPGYSGHMSMQMSYVHVYANVLCTCLYKCLTYMSMQMSIMFTHMFVYSHMCTNILIHIFIHIPIRMSTHMSMRMSIHMSIHTWLIHILCKCLWICTHLSLSLALSSFSLSDNPVVASIAPFGSDGWKCTCASKCSLSLPSRRVCRETTCCSSSHFFLYVSFSHCQTPVPQHCR